MQGQVAQAGGAGGPDAVLDSDSLTVPQFECGDGDARGVGGKRGQPQAVGFGDPQLSAGVRAFLADNQPHSLRLALEAVAVEFSDPDSVADFAARLDVAA